MPIPILGPPSPLLATKIFASNEISRLKSRLRDRICTTFLFHLVAIGINTWDLKHL
jgi:hypothetical protein